MVWECDDCGSKKKESETVHIGLKGNMICKDCADKQRSNVCRDDLAFCKECEKFGNIKKCYYFILLRKKYPYKIYTYRYFLRGDECV